MAGEFVLVFLWRSFGLNYIRNKNNLPSVKLTAPRRIATLSWSAGYSASETSRAMPAGASSPSRATQAGQVEG